MLKAKTTMHRLSLPDLPLTHDLNLTLNFPSESAKQRTSYGATIVRVEVVDSESYLKTGGRGFVRNRTKTSEFVRRASTPILSNPWLGLLSAGFGAITATTALNA